MRGIVELCEKGLLLKYIVASLFRVTWGFTLAVILGVPFGFMLGWYSRAFSSLQPAYPDFAADLAYRLDSSRDSVVWRERCRADFSDFPGQRLSHHRATIAAVQNMQPVYLRAAQNFGLGRWELFHRVIFRASLPQIITGVRIALGVAWLVVVAAEMIAVNSGLGYLIIDARNAGKRYDLVVAGMVMIGLIGLVLDLLVRQLEKFDEVRWGYAKR